MLSMRGIQKIYRTDLVETHALLDFSLDVKAGEFVALMGRSGSGKTTFLNIAGLLDTFDGGTYSLDGEDVSRLTDREMSRIRNQKIGFVFQSFNLIPDLDVFDNVDVPLGTAVSPRPSARSASGGPSSSSGSRRASTTCRPSSRAGSSSASRSRAFSRATHGSSSRTSPRGTSTRSCRARSWTSSRRSTSGARRS